LIENNIEMNCINDAGNCHFVIARTNGGNGSVGTADNLIIRNNYIQNLNGMAFDMGGVGDVVTNPHIYNNTVATQALEAANGSAAIFYSDSCAPCVGGVILNNIIYNTTAGSTSWSPIAGSNPGDIALENGNLVFTTGYTGALGSPYSTEATYAVLHSVNPSFANYPTNDSLLSTSRAIASSVALTTVAAGDSGAGTSLVVGDARFFQPGWANTQPDWIQLGTSTKVQISSINYSTNTITLANGVIRSSGTPVYLYKDSSGNVLLSGSNPNIGGYTGVTAPAPPTSPAAAVK
jgi:hypothetical protein